tara:strand:+ start:14 stop:337 length:324 start_codon:yes stop_codon:yes gene_type:complete
MEFRSMFHRRCTEDAARDLGLSVEDYIEQQKYIEREEDNEDRRDTTELGHWYANEDDGEWSVWLKVSADKDTILPDGKDKLVSARGISKEDALLMVDAKAAQLEGGE